MTRPAEDELRWSGFMAAAHRGDARSYEQLLRELAVVINQYVQRRFGCLPFAEDCVQECLLAIHAGRHTYNPKRLFRPWFFTIVRNKTIDLLRRSYAGKETGDPRAPDLLVNNEPGPAEEIGAGELLAQLDPRHRNALTLTKIFGYSLSEAAQRSGISESAMKSRVSRAVRAAENLLREEVNRE